MLLDKLQSLPYLEVVVSPLFRWVAACVLHLSTLLFLSQPCDLCLSKCILQHSVSSWLLVTAYRPFPHKLGSFKRIRSGVALSHMQHARLGSPAHYSGELSSFCTRVWRRAVHLFLVSIGAWSQSPSWLFPPGALLTGLTQWRQGGDGKQPIVYRVI